jgi:DNA-binding PadR family transcriptional regulator
MNNKQLKILQALESGPKTALAIAEHCGFRSFFLKSLQPPYVELAQMERKGLIISMWGEDRPVDRGGSRRKYYSLARAVEASDRHV